MALTSRDLQAIAGLLEPIHCRLDKVEGKLDKVEGRLDKVEGRLDKLESQVSALTVGQAEIRKDLKTLDKKITETYNLALDAWGQSTENRKWLETAN